MRVLSTIDRELLKPNSSVALHKHSNAVVDVLPPEADSSIAMLTAEEKPEVSYADIGGWGGGSLVPHHAILFYRMGRILVKKGEC